MFSTTLWMHFLSFIAGINLKVNAMAIVSQNKIYDGNWGIVLKEQGMGEVFEDWDCAIKFIVVYDPSDEFRISQ